MLSVGWIGDIQSGSRNVLTNRKEVFSFTRILIEYCWKYCHPIVAVQFDKMANVKYRWITSRDNSIWLTYRMATFRKLSEIRTLSSSTYFFTFDEISKSDSQQDTHGVTKSQLRVDWVNLGSIYFFFYVSPCLLLLWKKLKIYA